MDTKRAARYPFLKESAEFATGHSADLEALLTSDQFEQARIRGRQRVEEALNDHEVRSVDLLNDYDRLMEVMSYPYARMIVSMINDRYLTKRYALAEAVRMNKLLDTEDRITVVHISNELGVESKVDIDGLIRMRFPDFLRLASRIKAPEWKLINSEIHDGVVYLPQERFSRLLQNALQDKIESELPLLTPDEYRKYLIADTTHINVLLFETKKRLSATNGEGLNREFLPPCYQKLLDMSRNGMNLAHSARFSLVTFFNALGLGYDDIIKIFAESPDFNEDLSSYQIKHILGEYSGSEGYSCPECKTMKSNGLCFSPDRLCEQEWMTHPLKYYRTKAKDKQKKSEEPVTPSS